MSIPRIVYQEWIVELGRDPSRSWKESSYTTDNYNPAIISAVNRAMRALDEDEANFIRLYYMQGMSFEEISEATGKVIRHLEPIHCSAVRKLKRILHSLLGGKYRIPAPKGDACSLCSHPRLNEINKLIGSKTERDTWKRIIRTLRGQYDITSVKPQHLIRHRKYHMI